ncbi:response regulator transcription factor [Colwellia sp. MSW7]|uniref:Response regulator transcription factor n=1 Tax=Colwellia maritima TaxID=2912588 RepID=A0ABS9X197_9GAMM|nr:response regulator transcription factor [Colwellia maritima]MCI2283226.1 response regulator transcription factor [Colwellia maritima]
MSTILLVEDDISLANWVSEFLTEQNFTVIHLARGDLVLNKIKAQTIDLVLLDVMLPGLNGIEVCRLIRQHCQVPIMMLTARADEYDEVIGLEGGADDYVIKPVRPRALLARITRQLSNQQQETSSSNIITFGELTINQEAKRVTYFDQEIELSSSLFAFLTFLAERAGSVVDRDSVFKVLKKREYDGQDRRFDVMLSSLRKLFNDDPQKPKKFKTVWGKGYLFVSDAWGKDSQVTKIKSINKQED